MEIKALNLAAELAANLETRTRTNGDKFVCLVDGSPEWMKDVIHAAHGEAFPNDTTYELIRRNVNALSEIDESDAEDAVDAVYEIEPPIYNAELTAWLSESLDHIDYVDQALEEFGSDLGGVVALLSAGWKKQQEEIGNLLMDALEAEAGKQAENL